jgi:hypothetical protein
MSVFEQQLEQLERELLDIDILIEEDWEENQEAMDCFINDMNPLYYSTHYEALNQYIIELQKYEQAKQSSRLKIEQEMDEKTEEDEIEQQMEEEMKDFDSYGELGVFRDRERVGHRPSPVTYIKGNGGLHKMLELKDKFMKKYYKIHPYLLDYYNDSFIPLITHIQDCARDFPRFTYTLEYGSGFMIKDMFNIWGEKLPELDFLVERLSDLKNLLRFVKKLVILQRDYYHQTPERLNTIRIRNQTIRVMIFHHEITPQNIQEFLAENKQIFFQLRYGLKMVSG